MLAQSSNLFLAKASSTARSCRAAMKADAGAAVTRKISRRGGGGGVHTAISNMKQGQHTCRAVNEGRRRLRRHTVELQLLLQARVPSTAPELRRGDLQRGARHHLMMRKDGIIQARTLKHDRLASLLQARVPRATPKLRRGDLWRLGARYHLP